MNRNLCVLQRTNISCKGSVDTTINGVDTMGQNKGRNVKKSSSSVNTSPGQVDTTSSQVDTRDLSQGIDLPVWDSVSTHLKGSGTASAEAGRGAGREQLRSGWSVRLEAMRAKLGRAQRLELVRRACTAGAARARVGGKKSSRVECAMEAGSGSGCG
ncbi:hypothetical protein Taro_000601 [Colocasia esculenta]|uniref:Uncharacterized protein n=1 Tax=Colocasia esculenta TaxID=4460 RepID=A0A843TFQ2_COLES|nr:hypothetical protein [Colocasia esculenta]